MTHAKAIQAPVGLSKGYWLRVHYAAWRAPRARESAIVSLVTAAANYADQHAALNGSPIGQDAYCGEHWAQIVGSVRHLLNADCGRLDCGTVDSMLCDMLRREGFNPDNY